jgi:Tol biopolymer transport system component
VTQLTHFRGADQGGFASYSPDGTKIVLISGSDVTNGLDIMNADGSGLTRVISDPAVALSDWGPSR